MSWFTYEPSLYSPPWIPLSCFFTGTSNTQPAGMVTKTSEL